MNSEILLEATPSPEPPPGHAPGERRHRHRVHRKRRRPTLRPRMRFSWWQLGLAVLAVAMISVLLTAMQPWRTAPPAALNLSN